MGLETLDGDASDDQSIAERFVSARREARALSAYPGNPPQSLEQAYLIQRAAIDFRGGDLGGWKVGKINPPLDTEWGSNRLAGPIFVDQIVEAQGPELSMPVIADGFAAAEAEFMLRIGNTPDPSKTVWTLNEAKALVDTVAIGIEIASSPLRSINELGPAVTVSDFGNNHGLLVGSELPDWRDLDFDDVPVTLSINGVQAGAATTATMLDGPWGAVRFIAEVAARSGLPLRAGQWISTGAVTGVHPVVAGDVVIATFGAIDSVACTISAQASAHDPRTASQEVGS